MNHTTVYQNNHSRGTFIIVMVLYTLYPQTLFKLFRPLHDTEVQLLPPHSPDASNRSAKLQNTVALGFRF